MPTSGLRTTNIHPHVVSRVRNVGWKFVPDGYNFILQYAMLGVIHDVCRNWTVVRWGIAEFPRWNSYVSGGKIMDGSKPEADQPQEIPENQHGK